MALPTPRETAAAMTTEMKQRTTAFGGSALLGAALVALVLGGLTALVAALASGSAATWGALVGTAIVVGVFGAGSMAVDLVSRVLPAASLLVALMTYLLQVLVMGLVFVALSSSGALDGSVDAGWLAAVVIAGTVVWLACQVVLTARMRLPVYDLSDAGTR